MRLVVVALMLLIAGATHAAAQQYQLFPASVAATNLQVQHNAVLVNTATGDIYTCIGTLALEKNEPRLSGLGCQKGEINAHEPAGDAAMAALQSASCPHSSSASRFTTGASGFFLSQSTNPVSLSYCAF